MLLGECADACIEGDGGVSMIVVEVDVAGASAIGPTRRATFGGGLEISKKKTNIDLYVIDMVECLVIYLGGIFRRISTFCMGDAFRSSHFSTITVWLSSFDS